MTSGSPAVLKASRYAVISADGHAGADLWQLLKTVARQTKGRDDGRLWIADSKAVYSPTRGIKQLERGVLAALLAPETLEHHTNGDRLTLAGWIDRVAAPAHVHLREECWYVGDDLRDIQAGRAAGMATIAAAWGYCGHAEPATWEADVLAHTPLDVLKLIQRVA